MRCLRAEHPLVLITPALSCQTWLRPAWPCQVTLLRLALSDVGLICTGLQHISGLTKLQHLVLWNCLRLTEGGLSALQCLAHLSQLSLRGCQQLTDHALPHLTPLTALRQLNLTACERMSGMHACQVCMPCKQDPCRCATLHLTWFVGIGVLPWASHVTHITRRKSATNIFIAHCTDTLTSTSVSVVRSH